MPTIRPGLEADVPAVTEIYAHHVLNGTGTFELEAPTLAEMMQRRADVLARGLPYLVAASEDRVVGFAYCNWFKPRPAYRYSAEDSIYLAPQAQGRGIGRALLSELVARSERCGLRKLIAVVGDSQNAGSIGLHRSAGFATVGVLKSAGWKFGRWLDVVLMEKTLGWGDSCAPTIDR